MTSRTLYSYLQFHPPLRWCCTYRQVHQPVGNVCWCKICWGKYKITYWNLDHVLKYISAVDISMWVIVHLGRRKYWATMIFDNMFFFSFYRNVVSCFICKDAASMLWTKISPGEHCFSFIYWIHFQTHKQHLINFLLQPLFSRVFYHYCRLVLIISSWCPRNKNSTFSSKNTNTHMERHID